MKHERKVSLNRFVFSLPAAPDPIDPAIADYPQRVAYIGPRAAAATGLASNKAKGDAVIAAALHDLGTPAAA